MHLKLFSIVTTVLAVSACKDAPAKKETPPAPAPTAPVKAEPAPVKAEPTPAAPAAPAPAPAAPAAKVTYDCAALVTAADVKELCGADVTVTKSEMEGEYEITTCLRKIRRGPDDWKGMDLKLHPSSPAGARSLVTLEIGDPDPQEQKREVAAGDVARLHRRPDPIGGGTHQAFVAAKGAAYLELAVDTDKGKPELCSDDALIALGKRAVERLP